MKTLNRKKKNRNSTKKKFITKRTTTEVKREPEKGTQVTYFSRRHFSYISNFAFLNISLPGTHIKYGFPRGVGAFPGVDL